MAVQNAADQDAILIAFLNQRTNMIVDLEAPLTKLLMGAARKVTVNQKGREQAVLSDVRTNFKAGPTTMEYPIGVAYVRERMRTVPTEQVVTYEIDRATYQDYAAGNPGVMTNMAQELDLLAKGFVERREFFWAGDGSGKLGVLTSGSTTTVLNLDTVANGSHAKAYGVSQLKPGVQYDLYTSADALAATAIEIAEGGVNYGSNAVTLTAALGGAPAAGAYLVPTGSWYNLPHGLYYLLNGGKTGYWEGLTVTNKMEYQTPLLDAAGAAISNDIIERLLQKHAFRNGTGVNATFKFIASPSLISSYKVPGWNMMRFAASDTTYNTAFKNARYEDSIFFPYPKCNPDWMTGADLSDFVVVEQTPIGPFKGADGLLFHQQQGSNARGKGIFYMQYGCSDNLTINNPQKHIVARNFDLTGTTTISNFTATS